jgi:hypothetical protein
VLSFANQVSNDAVLFTHLEFFPSESDQFNPARSAADEQGQNRAIMFTS